MNTRTHAPKPIRWFPMDDKWKECLRPRNEEWVRQWPRLTCLQDKLLQIGGDMVCLRRESDLEKLLSHGRGWPVKGLQLRRGEPSECHANVCNLHQQYPHVAIVIGWGLSKDGLWRQHSFAWNTQRNHIIETTTKRIAYFGFRLTLHEAKVFCDNNDFI